MKPPIDIEEARVHYNFAAEPVIADLRRLASCGMNDLGIARFFGYRSAAGLMNELSKPEHAEAFHAVWGERAQIEVDCLVVIGTIRDTEGHRDQLKAAVYLLERVEGFEAKQTGNVVPMHAPSTPEDARARLRAVRDLQKAAS